MNAKTQEETGKICPLMSRLVPSAGPLGQPVASLAAVPCARDACAFWASRPERRYEAGGIEIMDSSEGDCAVLAIFQGFFQPQ